MMERMQINMRIDKELAARIDKKRIDLANELQRIPTRTEVIKMALELFIGDGPKPSSKAKRPAK